ncbi:MAG TPA: asparagine synthase C-terminal domain-containing protein, partial [Pyrinomonadaceae bacterium]
NGVTALRRYWTPDTANQVRFRDDGSYVERFRELLRQAVRDRLRDTRCVAISMSGGLDSTSLAAVALECGVDVHACAVVYDELIPDEERHYATAAANHLGIPISYVVADKFSLFDEQVPGDMDQPEPFLLSPLTAQFHSLLRLCEAHGRVAFTGYDGDAFMHEPRRSRLQVRTALRRMLRREFFGSQRHKEDTKEELRPSAMASLNSKVWVPLFEGYDPGATKLNLEVRHPFVDVRLVEYLLSIPRAPWCEHKHILRAAMKDLLPPAVLNRRKTPLAGDPALQIARSTGVRWLDSFEVNPQLESFVNLKQRRSVANEITPDDLWASLRVFALNYWLTHSQPLDRRATKNQVNKNRAYRTSTA